MILFIWNTQIGKSIDSTLVNVMRLRGEENNSFALINYFCFVFWEFQYLHDQGKVLHIPKITLAISKISYQIEKFYSVWHLPNVFDQVAAEGNAVLSFFFSGGIGLFNFLSWIIGKLMIFYCCLFQLPWLYHV